MNHAASKTVESRQAGKRSSSGEEGSTTAPHDGQQTAATRQAARRRCGGRRAGSTSADTTRNSRRVTRQAAHGQQRQGGQHTSAVRHGSTKGAGTSVWEAGSTVEHNSQYFLVFHLIYFLQTFGVHAVARKELGSHSRQCQVQPKKKKENQLARLELFKDPRKTH